MAINAGTVQAELDLNAKKYNQGMEKATRVMVNFGNMVKQKSQEMKSSLDALDKKQKLWSMTTDKVTKALQGNAKECDTLKQKINIVTKEIDNHEETLAKVRKEYGDNSKQAQEYENALLDLKIKQAELNEEMEKFTIAGKLKIAGNQMQEFGKNWTMKVTTPIVAAGTAAVVTTAKFDDQMSTVRAISGATGKEFDKLRNQARELGRETRFSASEAAQGMTSLAQMGFDVNEIYSAMPGMMNLAAAGALELGDAAGITANTLRAFGLEASQAGHVADVLAYAAANAGTDVQGMGQSMEYLAPIAKDMGWSLEETSAAVMALGDAGIYGAKAGAAFSTSLGRLAKPTDDAATLMEQLNLEFFDANGVMKPLPGIVGELEEKLADMTPQQKSAALTTLFGAEAYKHWSILVSRGSDELARMTKELETADGASKEMSETMEDNLAGSFRALLSAVEGAVIALGDALAPTIRAVADRVTELVRWFAQLDPAIQTNIARIGALIAAVGPMAVIGGTVAKGIGNIIGLFKMLSPVLAGITGKIAGVTTASGLLGKALTALSGPVGWTIAGITAVTAGGYALYKHLSQEAIPAVDLFGDEVSESTKKAVGGFLELHDTADMALKQLYWSGSVVTAETANEIMENFAQMGEQVRTGLEEDFKESKAIMQEFFRDSQNISIEEQQEILTGLEEGYKERQQKTIDGEARIKEILNTASQEKRTLTREEQVEINKIQDEMLKNGIRVLSESEKEQRIILSRMKNNAEELSAQQAADVVKNSKKQADETIKEAERQRDEVIAEIEYQRDELGLITEEQAEKLIREANRQCDETVANAKRMHDDVIKYAKEQAKKHVHEVDWSTGEIKSKWQAMLDKHREKVRKQRELDEQRAKQNRETLRRIRDNAIKEANRMATAVVDKYDELKTGALKKMSELKMGAIRKWEEIKNDAVAWGQNIVQGLINGIIGMGATLKANVENFINENIPAPIKKILGIASPSKLMALYGQYVAEGLAEGIKNNGDKVSNESNKLAEVISSAMNKVNNYATNTVSIIEKKFQLWALQNNIVKDSSEYLSQQLEVQKQKHEILNQHIEVTSQALQKIIEKYGEGSAQAIEYKNKLLDLKVAHAELGKEIEEATGKIEKQTDAIAKQFEVIKNGQNILTRAGERFVSRSSGSSGGKKDGDWYVWTGSDGKIKSGDKSDFDKDTGYDVDDSEVRRIARDNNVDMGVARDMAAANERRKRKGKKPEYHDGGWVGKPLFDIENILALIQKRLRYNEVAGILQEGEFVLSRDMLSRIQSAMTSADMVTTPRTTPTPQATRSAPTKGGDIHQHITINSPTPLTPSEIARKNLQTSRQLAMEWGL